MHWDLLYLVDVKFASGGLKDKAHLLGKLQGADGRLSFLLHFQGS